jgi:uroporphyrinogen-III decarboxylase
VERQYYLDLAAAGLRMPIGTHLVLHEHPDAREIVRDGERLGQVIEEAARRFDVPLALPLMDLTLEKEALLLACGIAPDRIDTFRFETPPASGARIELTQGMVAACDAIRYIATRTDLLPVGMGIGPFSLMTKLVSDPITPVFLAGTGATPDEEPEVALVERLLEVSMQTIERYLQAQMDAGAKAIILCEPAANPVYFSPNQLSESFDVFDRYVMRFNRTIRDQMQARGVDLIFHDCGELLDGMIRRFAELDPALLSLGSSRRLWEDAALVPMTTVLYGNLPTKQFYSDNLVPVARVRQLADELTRRMHEIAHPFILGSECDILSVPGSEETIRTKVDAFLVKPERTRGNSAKHPS